MFSVVDLWYSQKQTFGYQRGKGEWEGKKNRSQSKETTRTAIIKLKNTIAEIKNLLVKFNSVVEMTKDRISELEDTPIEFTQSEQHRKKQTGKKIEPLKPVGNCKRSISESQKHTNIKDSAEKEKAIDKYLMNLEKCSTKHQQNETNNV